MKAAVLDEQTLAIRIEERAVPVIAPHQVLIKVEAVGICGSDSHYYNEGKIGSFIVNDPLVLGHECAGEVVEAGSYVTHLKVGDRVAIEPGVPCRTCDHCRKGAYNQCPKVHFLATPPIDGAFLQYIAHDAQYAFKIPETMSYEVATLVEPLSVGIHAAKKVVITPGKKVAIFGMGPIGLTSIIAAKAFGASEIIAIDYEEKRLAAAKKLGASTTICLKDQQPLDAIHACTFGEGVDICFETAGAPQALQNALAVLKTGGKLALIGLPSLQEIPLNIPSIADREIEITGIFRYANTYPQGISILADYGKDLHFLFTQSFPLSETKCAMDYVNTNKADALKVMIYPNR